MKVDRGSVLIGALAAGVVFNAGALWNFAEGHFPKPFRPESIPAEMLPPRPTPVLPPVVTTTVSVKTQDEEKPAKAQAVPTAPPLPAVTPEPEPLPRTAVPETEDAFFQEAFAGLGPYVLKDIGVHKATGLPQDHVQLDPKSGRAVGAPANYTAPSKMAVYFPFLLKAAQQHPLLAKTGITRAAALERMKKALTTLRRFQKSRRGSEVYGGLFPWMELRGDGTAKIARFGGRLMVPVLDNGQLTLALWAWAGDKTISGAKEGTVEAEIRDLLRQVLESQHYEKWVDKETGLLYAEWNLLERKGTAFGDLNFWTEWMTAHFAASVQGKLPERGWLRLADQTFTYKSALGPLDMPQGHVFSMHELWGLAYTGDAMMASKLRPLLLNYFYLHAEHSRNNNVPGIVATEYGLEGYTQSGIDLGKRGKGRVFGTIEEETLSTAYGTALASLIDPAAGRAWMTYHLKQPGVVKLFGPVTSFTRFGGASSMVTADAGFMTAVALSGGVSREIEQYAQDRYKRSPRELAGFFDKHAEAILKRLGKRTFDAVTPAQIPLPPEPGDFSVKGRRVQELSGTLDLSARFQAGHWHGANIGVPSGFESWRKDKYQIYVMKQGEIAARYQITKDKPYAWVGIPVSPVSIRGARYLSVWVPADLSREFWELEFKNSSEEVAYRVPLRTSQPGEFDAHRRWKRLVIPLRLIHPERATLNYVAVSVPDPFVPGTASKTRGLIRLKGLELHSEKPDSLRY